MPCTKKTIFSIALLLITTAATAKNSQAFIDGEQLFRTAGGYGCSTCHGMFAQGGGNVGGNIRGKTLEDINLRLDNEPTMKLLSDTLTTDDRKVLAYYLETLGHLPLIEWTIDDKATDVEISINQGVPSQLVIFNKLLEPLSLSITSISDEPEITINPYETKAYEWKPKLGVIELSHKQSKIKIHVQ